MVASRLARYGVVSDYNGRQSAIKKEALMYVALRIGIEERDRSRVTESWVRDQLGCRRADVQNVCVQLIVYGGDVDMRPSTPGCGAPAVAGARRGVEVKIIEMWREGHLNSAEFSHGNVWSMFRRVRQAVG
jgi:hypothetical protein